MYRVVIYCPDRHLVYRGSTPDREGVGGGVTVRIRLAQALAALGHRPTIVGHVPRTHRHRGVEYWPLHEIKEIDCDVLVVTTSGGALDLRPIQEVRVEARLREVWVHGTVPLAGLDEVPYDHMVVVSNFIRRWVHNEWHIPGDRIFVAYNGCHRPSQRLPRVLQRRNPFHLLYANHPSKGLDAALAVFRHLRERDDRFLLHVYGGASLWGEEDVVAQTEPGVTYHGLVGQRRLARELERAGFTLSLQRRPEPCSTLAMEAMAAGAILLASPVGSFPELIRSGYDGFLVDGDPGAADTHQLAATLVHELARHPDWASYIRRNARSAPADWLTLARTWVGHWRWALAQQGVPGQGFAAKVPTPFPDAHCAECEAASLLPLADGYHCTGCGCYTRFLP